MVRITLRVPENLYEQITATAQTSRRSINSQILWLIEKGLVYGGEVKTEGDSRDIDGM